MGLGDCGRHCLSYCFLEKHVIGASYFAKSCQDNLFVTKKVVYFTSVIDTINLKTYFNFSDEDLWIRIQDGNQLAFEELYNRYWEKLLNIAYSRLDDAVSAQDVVQQLFIDIYVNRDKIVIQSSLVAYLQVALKYKVIDCYRQRLKIDNKLVSLKEAATMCSDSVEEAIEAKHAMDKLEELLILLPEKCRQVFELSRFEGKSQAEISQELNISISTIKKHMNKAISILRSAMKSDFLLYILLYSYL